jgi:NADH-quinone oxidoreductase subunit I/NADH dehydrogenase (ubiquinone) Fe-S protein 8
MRNIIDTLFFTEILQGMGVTLKHMFKKPVTLKYPFEKPIIFDRFRGIHYIKTDENGNPKCVGCYLCQKVCPAECIYIETDAGPNGERLIRKFEIELDRCIYCGFCEEACPKDAIHMGKRYDTVDSTRGSYRVNMNYLVKNYRKGE